MPTIKKVAKTARATKSTKKTAKKTVKKAAKKVSSKVAKKATKTKTSTKKALRIANNQQSFWVTDGQILNSLLALRDALDAMEKDVYAYHADGWQNDFAQWVEIVLEDSACANDLRKAKTPRSARTVIVKHLKFYKVNAGGREDALGYTS
ncbi:hypothetical protein KC851_01570 [Candidatus Kaiserbacteria bacterium]|nr:hypothetical protein [Candidatus Kaiserbacteria bacterium]